MMNRVYSVRSTARLVLSCCAYLAGKMSPQSCDLFIFLFPSDPIGIQSPLSPIPTHPTLDPSREIVGCVAAPP